MQEKDFYRCGARAVRDRWLECGKASPLRTSPACLLKFGMTIWKEAKQFKLAVARW